MTELIRVAGLPTFSFGHCLTCCYCGDLPNNKDHVIPISWQHDYRAETGPWTWACSHCNRMLWNHWFTDFDSRCRWVADRIDQVTRPVVWSEAEIAKLDYSLQTVIRQARNKNLWLRNRGDWYGSRDFYNNLEPLLWEEHLDRYSGCYHKPLADYFRRTTTMLRGIASKPL